MKTSEKVLDVVSAFSPSFKSLDLRMAAVKVDNEWTNLIASIFFSNKSPEDVRTEQQRISAGLPSISDGDFGFLFVGYPFNQLSEIFQQIYQSKVTMRRKSIKFQSFDPYELRVNPFLPNYLKEVDEWKLCGAEGRGSEAERRNLWPLIDAQDKKAKLLGYDNIYELINDVLRIRDFDRGRERDFVIGIPIYARIIDFTLAEVKIRKHFALNDLQINLSLNRITRRGYSQPIKRRTETVPKCQIPSEGDFCVVANTVQFGDMKPHDRVEVELINRKAPMLSLDGTSKRVPLENVVEPFAKTLFQFCPFEEYKKRLLHPESFPKSDKVFQEAVSWLLSLAGFSIIPLGKTEHEKITTETRYEVGSIDLLGYRENEFLLLAECDTSIPNEKKIRSLLQLKDHFKFIQDKQGEPLIVAAIFSPRDCRVVVGHDVSIVDRQRIKRLLDEAIKGNIKKMREYLTYFERPQM